MKLLITGICGFVGSSLAEGLLERRAGISIVGVDNLMRTGSELNRAKLRRLGVTFIHGASGSRAILNRCRQWTG